MEFQRSFFSQSLLPKEIQRFQAQLQTFTNVLMLIVEREINAGNRIRSVQTDNSITEIILAEPFSKNYPGEGYIITVGNTPHDYSTSYQDESGNFIVTAPRKAN